MSFAEAEKELKEVILSQGFGGDVQLYMARRGYEGKNVEPLVAAIRKSHQAIRGKECPPVSTGEISMRNPLSLTGTGFVFFPNADSTDVFDLKSMRDDSRPILSMVSWPSMEINHSAKSLPALGFGAFI